jgi:hypothetical protein
MPRDILSDALRRAAKASGVAPSVLAWDIGVAPSMLTRFIHKQRSLNLATAGKLCDRLGLTLTKRQVKR